MTYPLGRRLLGGCRSGGTSSAAYRSRRKLDQVWSSHVWERGRTTSSVRHCDRRKDPRPRPHTGQPILEPTQRGWWDRLSGQTQAYIFAGVVLCVVVLVTTLGVGSSGHQLSGVVHGDVVGAGNVGSGDNLTWSDV